MPIEIDRSRVIAYQTCPRSRFLGYHACGKGLQRKAKSLPLQVGSAFHAGAECLLQGDIETACYRAIKFLHDAFSAKGVGMDGEDSTDQSLVYSAQEQAALVEGLIRGWGLEKMPEFLQTFEVIEAEKEGRAILVPEPHYNMGEGDMVLMYRPDALVRDRLSGDYYICSWKTTSAYGKRNLLTAKTDMQSMSEMFGVEQERQIKVEGILYLFAVKGKRQLDEWNNRWQQNSHLAYGWRTRKLADEFDDGWAWTFKYPREDGSGNSTLGKGWQRQSVWDNYPGGVKQWIEDLHNRQVFPRHLDPFDGIFPQSLPVERRRDEIDSWRRQVIRQENTVAERLWELGHAENKAEALDYLFPQYSHSCHQYNYCQFLDLCWNGVPAVPGELYSIRKSNHPEGGDEDES